MRQNLSSKSRNVVYKGCFGAFPPARPNFGYAISFMRAFTLFLLLLTAGLPASAQRYKRTLKGEVRIAGYSPQYYYIYYTANGASISGYSVTQTVNGDLRATLTGRISDDGTELYLREVQSLDPMEPGMTLCFFAARLKLNVQPDRRVWSGAFSSRQPNGEPCEGGLMIFTDLNPVPPPPPKPVVKKEDPPPPKPVRPKERVNALPVLSGRAFSVSGRAGEIIPALRAIPGIKIPAFVKPPVRSFVQQSSAVVITARNPDTARISNPLYWKNEEVTIDIWDGVQEDGDVVSVSFNGTPLLTAEKLTRTKKTFRLKLLPNQWNIFTITLLQEGNLPENTLSLTLSDGQDRIEREINGLFGQQVVFYMRRK